MIKGIAWKNQVKLSHKIYLNYDDNQIKELALAPSTYHNFRTIGDRWDSTIEELRENARKLQGRFPGQEITGYLMRTSARNT